MRREQKLLSYLIPCPLAQLLQTFPSACVYFRGKQGMGRSCWYQSVLQWSYVLLFLLFSSDKWYCHLLRKVEVFWKCTYKQWVDFFSLLISRLLPTHLSADQIPMEREVTVRDFTTVEPAGQGIAGHAWREWENCLDTAWKPISLAR